MKKFSYNLDKLIKIRVYDFCESGKYVVVKEKRSWLFNRLIQESGYKQNWIYGASKFYKELPKGYKLIEGVVCLWPRVELHFEDDHKVVKYFESIEAAFEYKAFIKKEAKAIWLDIDLEGNNI